MSSSILALDLGEKRVGVARADSVARLARPLITLANDETFLDKLQELIAEHNAKQLVVGLPRNMRGQPTEQTRVIQNMAADLQRLGLKIQWQDETLTSRQAEAELARREAGYNHQSLPMDRDIMEIRASELKKPAKSRRQKRRQPRPQFDSYGQRANYKEAVDALAACLILEDFLRGHPQF